jgi:hypothetical protein
MQVSDMDFKPGDDLSYYLGPAATCATEAQCKELRQALLEAERAVGSDVKKDRQTKVLCDALKEAVLQLEYLNGKFQPTGTTAAVLARIRAVLDEQIGGKDGR